MKSDNVEKGIKRVRLGNRLIIAIIGLAFIIGIVVGILMVLGKIPRFF